MKKIIPFEKEIDFKTMVSSITSISLEHTLRVKEDNLISGYFIVEGTYKMTQASQIDEEFSYKIPVDIEIDDKYDTTNIIIDIDDFTYKVLENDKLLLNISLCIDALTEKEQIQNEELVITELEDVGSERDVEVLDEAFLETSVPEKLDIKPEIDSLELEVRPKKEETKDINKNTDMFINPNLENIKQDMGSALFINESVKNNIETKPAINNNSNINDGVESLFSSFKDGIETFKTYSVYIVKEEDSIESIQKKYNIDRESLEEYNDLTTFTTGCKIIIPSKKNE